EESRKRTFRAGQTRVPQAGRTSAIGVSARHTAPVRMRQAWNGHQVHGALTLFGGATIALSLGCGGRTSPSSRCWGCDGAVDRLVSRPAVADRRAVLDAGARIP